MHESPITRRSAIAALAIVIPAPSIAAFVSFWVAPGEVGLLVYALCKAVLYGTPALWGRFIDGQSWAVNSPRRQGWLVGIALGVLLGSAVLIAWTVIGNETVDVEALRDLLHKNGLSDGFRFFIAAAWICLVNSLLEEYAFRWFMTSRMEVLSQRGAVVFSALAFAAHHLIILFAVLPATLACIAGSGVFCAGLAWSWLYRQSGSVWPGWISHVLVDLAIMGVGWQALR